MHMSSEVNAGRCIRRSRSVDSPNTSHRMRTRAWRVQSLLPPVCLLLSLLGSGVVSPRFPSLCRRRRLLPGQTNAKLSAHVIDLSLVHPCRSDDRCLRKGSRRTDTVKSTALEAAFFHSPSMRGPDERQRAKPTTLGRSRAAWIGLPAEPEAQTTDPSTSRAMAASRSERRTRSRTCRT